MKPDLPRMKQLLDNDGLLHLFAKSAFDEVDEDGSGFIDRAELATLLHKAARDFGERAPMDDEVRAEFATLDTNNDEQISYDEFTVLIIKMLRRWSDLMDKD